MRTKELFVFVQERHRIFERRAAGLPKPWTKNNILQTYRFCNVYRELDTVTVWIRENWRSPNINDKYLWFAMVVARFVNWPESLSAIGYPVPWDPDKFLDAMHARSKFGLKTFSGAYIVSTNGHRMDKAEYLVKHVLTPLWEQRNFITSNIDNASLAYAHSLLSRYNGLGSFMAGQVIADLKYGTLASAHDWWDWAASGPGSRRGLNRIMEREVTAPWKEEEWLGCMKKLMTVVKPFVEKCNMPRLHMQDLQNSLCETDKMMRVQLGEGRPRSLYPGR